MRHLTMAFGALFFIAGCDEEFAGGDQGAEQIPPTISISSVIAEDCADVCSTITITLSVNNGGLGLWCVPSVYGSDSVNGAIMFRYKDSGEYINTSEAYDPNVFYSSNYHSDMKALVETPQYVFGPGDSRHLTVVMQGKFDLQPRSATTTLRTVIFPCSDDREDTDFRISDLNREVDFR